MKRFVDEVEQSIGKKPEPLGTLFDGLPAPIDKRLPDSFFAPLPAPARRSDPSTSRDAGALMERTGTSDAQANKILALLRRSPNGLTSVEIDAELFADDRNVVACKRLPEMEKRKQVLRTGEQRANARVWKIWRDAKHG